MVRPVWFLWLLVACGNDVSSDLGADGGNGGDATGDLSSTLPCEVRAIIEGACVHCHSAPTAADAPMSLLSRADFLRPSTVDGVTVGALSLDRLRELPSPMPPKSEPPLAPAHRAILESWFAAGMPAGTCEPLPAKPLTTPCASGSSWSNGDDGSVNMNPGRACRDCHVSESAGDAYFFSGTVFNSFHGRDLCNTPPPASARIEILDMQGNVTLTMTARSSGNFHSPLTTAGVSLPYRARLVANGLTREMRNPQMSGDCNSCHTEQGTHTVAGSSPAPGRIVWPSALVVP